MPSWFSWSHCWARPTVECSVYLKGSWSLESYRLQVTNLTYLLSKISFSSRFAPRSSICLRFEPFWDTSWALSPIAACCCSNVPDPSIMEPRDSVSHEWKLLACLTIFTFKATILFIKFILCSSSDTYTANSFLYKSFSSCLAASLSSSTLRSLMILWRFFLKKLTLWKLELKIIRPNCYQVSSRDSIVNQV